MDHILGIDFGTSNSTVYLFKNGIVEALTDENGSSLFPSYVMYLKDKVVTGSTAKRNMGGKDRYVVSCVKRLIGQPYSYYEQLEHKNIFGCEVVEGEDGYPYFVVDKNGRRVNCVDVACELFKEFKRRADAYCHPRVFDAAYLTVPADYKDFQCEKIKEAAKRAGLSIKKLITEPAAAALSWYYTANYPIQDYEKLLVYDFGGGTFDASIMRYTKEEGFVIIDQAGDPYLGGNDIDIALSQYIENVFKKENGYALIKKGNREWKTRSTLKERCEEIKLTLSLLPLAEFDSSAFTDDDSDSITISRTIFNTVIQPLIQKTMECVEKLLQRNDILPGTIRYFFTIGGSSRLELVSQKTKEMFGNCVFPEVNTQQCVALGAAMMMKADHSSTAPSKTIKEVLNTSFGLGVDENNVLLMVKKGGKLPLTGKSYLFKNADGKREVTMHIFKYGGEVPVTSKAPLVKQEDCRYVYDLRFSLPENCSVVDSYIEIEFSMDVGGVLCVSCYNPVNGRELVYSHVYEAVYGSYSCVCSVDRTIWMRNRRRIDKESMKNR